MCNYETVRGQRTDSSVFCLLFSVFCLLSTGLSFAAEEFIYKGKGNRDPFVPLIGAGAVYQVKGEVDVRSVDDISLEGIVYDEKGPSMAIINGTALKEGAQIGAAVIEKIEPKKITVRIEDKSYEVSLEREKGGEAQ